MISVIAVLAQCCLLTTDESEVYLYEYN